MRQSFTAVKVQPAWIRLFIAALFISGCLLLVPTPGPAESQDPAKESANKQSAKDMQNSLARAKELQAELKEIQAKAIENNEELAAMLKDLKQTFNEKFKENLAEAEVDVQRLQEIGTKVKNQEVPAEKKKELQKEFQSLYTGYQEAKVKTLENEEIQKQNKAFSNKLEVAMNEENPEAKAMLEELEGLRARMKGAMGRTAN
ncbi:MAG: hypothetical protein K9K64_07810 [Desulfohalobiaceae bacterium]|nr:hypothetical protein [Desulfohalobiaceae bacterium]